jgi:hypothetical protein
MAARWLVVKVLDEEHFENQYRLNQLDGVDCMEVTAEKHPQLFRDVVDSFDEDINRVIEDMS